MSQFLPGAVIAARMGSSRFPGKTLADLCGRPMLGRLVDRIREARCVDRIILATTELPEDDDLESWCAEEGVSCFRGSADDVLGRLVGAIQTYMCDPVVEILGDNPLVHADLIDACMKIFRDGDVDYVATVTNEYPLADAELKKFPIGVRVQVLRQSALTRCSELATSASAREHATSFIAAHPEIFPTAFLEASGPFSDCHRPELTFAVNYPGNLELIRALFGRLADERPFFGVGDAIRAFDGDTDLARFMGEPS